MQEVCFFCAFHYGREARPSPAWARHQIRTYKASVSSLRPAGAAAVRLEEDDEDEPSFQNNGLTGAATNVKRNQQFGSDSSQWKTGEASTSPRFHSRSGAFHRGLQNAQSPQSFNTDARHRSRNYRDRDFRRPAEGSTRGGNRREPEIGGTKFAGQKVFRFDPNRQDPVIDGAQNSDSGLNTLGFAPPPNRKEGDRFSRHGDSRAKFRYPPLPSDRHPERSGQDSQPRRHRFDRTPSIRDSYNTAPARSGNFVFEGGAEMPVADSTVPPSLPSEYESFDESKHRHKLHDPNVKRDRRSRLFEDDIDSVVSGGQDDSMPLSKRSRNRSRTVSHDPDFDLEAAEAELYGDNKRKKKSKKVAQVEVIEPIKPKVTIPEFISVENLARMLKLKVDDFVAKLEEEGYEGARYDHILDSATSGMFADLYGFEPVVPEGDKGQDLVARPVAEDTTSLLPRPPIVTIMGHVDHGKTTILDWLRKSSVADTEHGGITQHIGAFSVTMPGTERQITFLDTPGHAAFLDMRRRGANVTDIVVLVVAADDSVKPQTIEAIKHALEARVHIIVAINKIDKEDANIERVKQDLSRHDITVEDYGGEFQAIPVSGKTGQGMEDLEEAIITLADVSDFRAEVDGPAEGWIIESKVTTAGRVATVLVRRGTLRQGDFIVAGTTWARIRTLRNDSGQLIEEAPPGTPVQIDGWRGEDPTAGLEVLQADSEDHAKDVVKTRQDREEIVRTTSNMAAINTARTEEAEARAKVLAWEAEQEWSSKRKSARPKDNEGWVENVARTGPKHVHFIIKADVAGSVEALTAAVSAIGNNEIVANVVHSGIGVINESDIRRLATTGEVGYAISFNQTVEGPIRRLAEMAGLGILDHNIIYKVTDDVKDKVSAELPPLITQRVVGEAEIGQIFEISTKKGKVKIAGCKISNGTISRAEKIRVIRKGNVVYTGMLLNLFSPTAVSDHC